MSLPVYFSSSVHANVLFMAFVSQQNYSSDSKEENERLRQLLQDDFVDDPDVKHDGIKPLQLPMIPLKKKGNQKNSKQIFSHLRYSVNC